MSLHGKFRILLAIFGLSIVLNVLVSVWCIHIYVAQATQRFQVLLVRTRHAQDIRRILEELTAELRDRGRRTQPLHDLRYRHLAGSVAERIAELTLRDETTLSPDRAEQLEELAHGLVDAGEHYVGLLTQGQADAAETFLAETITRQFVDPLHRLLADTARTTDQALTRTSADIDRTQAKVTLLLAANAALAFLLAAAAVHLLRNWVLRPVDALKRTVEYHARGELSHRAPVPSSDELGMLAAALNRSAAALAEYQQRLVEQERLAAIGEVASSVAHNIRNPLASLRAAAQAALPDFQENDPNRARLEEMIATVDALNRWLRELLMVSQPIALQRQPVEVRAIVERVLTVMQPAIGRRGIHVAVEQNGDCRICVDAPRVEQALLAVVDNAVEASPAAGEVHIAAQSDATGEWIDLTVQDAGPGIAADVAEHIAKPYFSTKPGGTGIGLHLARRIVQAHGGTLSFNNAPAGGTMVTLRLPAANEGE